MVGTENLDANATGLIGCLASAATVLWRRWPRNMIANLLDTHVDTPEGIHFTLAGMCPHCHRETVFMMVTNPDVETTHGSAYKAYYKAWAVMLCVGCKKHILGAVETENHATDCKYLEHFPLGTPNDDVASEIPDELRPSFQEAIRCCWVRSFQASVLMCRRCLQVSCDREKAQGKDLFSQIDNLASAGRITETLRKMAHRIRLLGKRGAHGDYSDIDSTITDKDAIEAIEFMQHYLEHVYVLPAKLDKEP